MQSPLVQVPLEHCGPRVQGRPDASAAMQAVPLHQKAAAQLVSPLASLLGHEVPQAVMLAQA
jgi:hypothetical protein